MDQNRLEKLEEELNRNRAKLNQMQKDWAETRAGSAYGSEYLEIQIKVYQAMIIDLENEIEKCKKQGRG